MSYSERSLSQLSNYFVGLFFLFAVTTGAALVYLVNQHNAEMAHSTAVRTAKTTAENIDFFRSFYSKNVVQNVLDGGIKVTHEYHGNPLAIPLPATLSIELGDYMRAQAANIDYKLYSDKPFPWRIERKLDDDELRILAERSREEAILTSNEGSIRFFSPVIMGDTCIACHNNHPESPKTDWQVGDVRGYQVITLPPNFSSILHSEGVGAFEKIILFFVAAFGSAFFVILYLVSRNKAAFERVQEYATSEAQKSTELSDANTRLKKSLSELNAVLENAADGIVTIDERGCIISANAASEKIFGYRQSEMIGENIKILMGDQDASAHDTFIGRFLDTGKASIIGVGREVTARRSNGDLFPVELSIGHIQHEDGAFFTGILRDVSERKRAEEELRESQEKERLLSLVASLTDNAVIITDADGRIRWVNDGFEKLTGYSLHEAQGRNPGDLLQGDKTDRGQVAKMAAAINKRDSFEAELINYTRYGKDYWVQLDAKPIITANGEFDGYIAIERDVTRDKEKSAELIQAREAAEESNKSKSRFLAMMSHEIRTPLNAIIGTISLLNDERDVTKRDQFLSTAKKAASNLQSIINDILDISKLEVEDGVLEPTISDPVEMLTDVIEVMKPRAAEKGIVLVWSKGEDIAAKVNTDIARLRQILINFISNAIKFTDAGTVSVAIRSSIDIVSPGIRFEISDTGVGIAGEDLPHIFDEFWTKNLSAKNTAPGTGLGLAISKRLAESLGGLVGVSSRHGEGSVFWFELPVGDVDPVNASQPLDTDLEDLPEQFSAHVLIAEDNSANQLVASAMLEKLGVTSDVVANGIEAIAALEHRSYDIVLMDVNMPEMDGIETTKAIRKRNLVDGSPIIAMTANVMEGDEDKLRAEGFDDYLGKPFVGVDLRRVLNKNLRARRPT